MMIRFWTVGEAACYEGSHVVKVEICEPPDPNEWPDWKQGAIDALLPAVAKAIGCNVKQVHVDVEG